MASKNQDYASGIDALFSDKPQLENKQQPAENVAEPIYSYSLKMPLSWKEQISFQAWRRRMTIKDLLNEIVGAWVKEHGKEGM